MYIFAGDDLVREHNRERLNQLKSPLYSSNAIDKIPPEVKVHESQIEAMNIRKVIDKVI